MKKIISSVILLAVLSLFSLSADDNLLYLNDNNFLDETKSGVYVVDFYADWCGPCRAFAPTFEAVAGDLPEYKFVKVDVDSNPGLARHYQINFIPFIVAVKDGKIVAEYKGVRTKEDFTAWVKKVNVQNK
jgi:thioredoxin 1